MLRKSLVKYNFGRVYLLKVAAETTEYNASNLFKVSMEDTRMTSLWSNFLPRWLMVRQFAKSSIIVTSFSPLYCQFWTDFIHCVLVFPLLALNNWMSDGLGFPNMSSGSHQDFLLNKKLDQKDSSRNFPHYRPTGFFKSFNIIWKFLDLDFPIIQEVGTKEETLGPFYFSTFQYPTVISTPVSTEDRKALE